MVLYGSGFIRTPLGILKVIEILCTLLAIILTSINGWTTDYIDALYVGIIVGMVVSVLILVFSITSLGQSLDALLRYQCFLHAMLFVYLVIVSSITIDRTKHWTHDGRYYLVGAIFGLVSSVAYLADAALCYKEYGNSVNCR